MKRLYKLIMAIVMLQGIVMGVELKHIETKGAKIPVLFEKSNYLPIVSFQLVFTDAGHLSETKDAQADMTAKILNEGTKKEGAVGFAQKLDDHAVELSAHVGRETFVVELSSLKEEFDYAAERLYELLSDPNFTPEALAQVKRQKLGWLKRKQSDYDFIAARNLRALLFKGTPLARPYEGTKESVEAMKLEDLKRFYRTKLGYDNLIVVAGGDLNYEEVKAAIEALLPLLPKSQTEPVEKIRASDRNETVETNASVQQAYIYFGAPFDYSYEAKDQYKAKIAEYILGGGGFGSRMMEELRVKRGLTYGAYAMLRRAKYASYLSGYLQTKLISQNEAVSLVREVVREFVEKGVTQKELDAAKEFLVGSEPLRTETLSQRLHRAYTEYYYGRPLGFSEEQRKKIESATLDEINAFIKAHPEIANVSFSIVTKKIKD